MASHKPINLSFRLLLCALAAGSVLIASSACSRTKSLPPLTRRIAVLDFKVPPEMVKKPRQIEGWWLGAETINQNPWAGSIFADTLARELLRLNYLQQQSRNDLKYYMGEKRQRLADKFDKLEPAEYDRMLQEVAPVDYGAELGVDQVISGEILEAYTSQHRTFKNWSSTVKVRVDLHDVASGKVVWSRVFSEKDHFVHPLDVMEKIAPRVVKAMDIQYFRRQNRQ